MRTVAIVNSAEAESLISLVEAELDYLNSVCNDTSRLERTLDKLQHALMLLKKDESHD